MTAKFRDTEHLRFEDTKRIMSPENFRETGPKARVARNMFSAYQRQLL